MEMDIRYLPENRRTGGSESALAGKPRQPRRQDHDMVSIRIAWDEFELRTAVKQAGAIWRARQRIWELD